MSGEAVKLIAKKGLFAILLLSMAQLHGCARHLITSGNNDSVAIFQTTVKRMLNDRSFQGSIWGILAYSLSTGDTLYQENQNMLLVPASNSKIITSAAAYYFLGPEFRYETVLATDGILNPAEERLTGNLYIIGSGDPTLGSPSFKQNPVHVLNAWVDSLKSLGIREISGDIVALDTCFNGLPYGEGWEQDDLLYSYGAPSSGLSFFENCVNVVISPGNSAGKRGNLTFYPPNSFINVANYTKTISSGYRRPRISLKYNAGDDVIEVYGTIPVRARTSHYLATVSQPAAFLASSLRHALLRKGIQVRGNSYGSDELSLDIDSPTQETGSAPRLTWNPPSQRLMVHYSPPLQEILELMNKSSINLYAEQVLRTVGREVVGDGSVEGGRLAVSKFMVAAGVDSGTFYPADGSGLSRHNLFSAAQMVSALAYMSTLDTFEGYVSTMAMPGEDGTLKNRFSDSPVMGNLFAKTGTLQNVRALSGYLRGQHGNVYAFSIIVNNFTCNPWQVIEIQNNFCTLLTQLNLKNESVRRETNGLSLGNLQQHK